jgi:rRNA maturation endonuclease Nob1
MKTYLEKAIEEKSYEDLGEWKLPDLADFSRKKQLYEYQTEAIRHIGKVLHEFFETYNNSESDHNEQRILEAKKRLYNLCLEQGMTRGNFQVKKYENANSKKKGIKGKRFPFFKDIFKVKSEEGEEYIGAENFFNRACFWMATGSGKSLVLIKTIEFLDYLQRQNFIPKKEIMILLPRQDLINQFAGEVEDFNQGRERKIELVDLKKYDEDKNSFDFGGTIKVYCYRSDLLRDKRSENILDYKSYDNGGDWFVFLDEAHRGEKENSLVQNYVTALSRNGFLFNFSATFTEALDYATTCFNFNLEKFIEAGYGKNLYLSNSYFNFGKEKGDFTDTEKQKQVLKSLLTFVLVKKTKKKGKYHHPLMVTLVNSVNTGDSDLLMFFKKLEEIAGGDLDKELFQEAKKELLSDMETHQEFVFGDERLDFDKDLFARIDSQEIFRSVFNAENKGKIEILEGEKGKEIVLKLETADNPFALIKIGDAGKFQKEKLGAGYTVISGFDNKKMFEEINKNENINLLLGSRSFYEGWDSNRPNVINMINIGKKDAKKFVLQGIGRGIRIEPDKEKRKRLDFNDPAKNILLETLFVFATDKSAVKAIVETVEENKSREENLLMLKKNENIGFDLLVPVYGSDDGFKNSAKFYIEKESLDNFRKFFNCMDGNFLAVKYGLSGEDYKYLWNGITSGNLFAYKEGNKFYDMEFLMKRIIEHISVKNKYAEAVKPMSDEIIHFKHVKISNLSEEEVKSLKEKAEKVKQFNENLTDEEIEEKIQKGEISYKKAKKLNAGVEEENFKDLTIKNAAKHYYLPLIYAEKEKIDYIKHIITVPSEVRFLKNLNKFIADADFESEWMFSKIDESLDSLHMPYFDKKDNRLRRFFPDFIFWVKKGRDYKIILVDPKGTSNSDYQNKIDEFERLFLDENGEKKVFSHKDYKITFDLKLVAENINSVGNKYAGYWLSENDFGFIE